MSSSRESEQLVGFRILANKEPMNLQSTLTNIPKARLWKTLSKVGEILFMVLAILVLIALLFSYLALSFISPAG